MNLEKPHHDILKSKYAEYFAIFFTENGIIIGSKTSCPLLHFAETVKRLNLTLENIFLDHSVLFVKCKIDLRSEYNKIIHNDFYVQSARDFLISTNKEELQLLLFRAIHWVTWDGQLKYCSKCGNKLQHVYERTEKKCGLCDLSFFPNLSPAIMVLIQKDNEILLARSAHFKPGIYSALAGFIDIGETAEAAVHREVKEEVDLEISELEYFATQSWPFPNSFMIAFKAKYLRGDLNIDTNEIEDAAWFNLNNLPELPSHPSISRKLIESFILKR